MPEISHDTLVPGDVVFAHSNGIMGRAIRFAEKLRWSRGSHWNHVAVISRIEDGVAYVIQADLRGVNEARLDTIGEFTVVETSVNPAEVLEFMESQLGSGYGIGSIVSIVFDIISPNWFPEFRRDNTWICSALVAEALRYAGWLHPWGSIYTVTPAQLFDVLQ